MKMKINKQPDTPLQINDATDEQIPSLNWLTLNGEKINIIEEIEKSVKYWSDFIGKERLKFIVSCDSQRHGGKVVYVTTIVFLKYLFTYNLKSISLSIWCTKYVHLLA